jgi:hypothetical protein
MEGKESLIPSPVRSIRDCYRLKRVVSMFKVNKELGSIQLYTSSGLDIERMINNKDYNLKVLNCNDVEWLCRSNDRHSTSLNRVIPVRRNVGKIYLFITLLHWMTCASNHIDAEGWLSLSQKKLDKYFRSDDICKITRILKGLGVINIDPFFTPGVRSKRYRFTRTYRYSQPIPINENYYFSKKTKINWVKNWKRVTENDFEEWMCRMVEEVRILPEAEAAVKDINFDGAIDREAAINSAYDGIKQIQSFEAEDPGDRRTCFVHDGTVGRIHTNVTGLKSESRSYLRHGDKKIVVLDLVASHPFWLLRLYKAMGDNPKVKAEALKYYQFYKNGDFYQNVADGIECSLSRSELKTAFFEEFLYVRHPSGDIGPLLEAFYKKNFPILHREMSKRRKTPFLPLDDPHWRKASKLWKTNVELIKVESAEDIPAKGKMVVYLALVKGVLHIRAFDAAARMIFDKSEKKLPKAKKSEVVALKEGLVPFWDAPKLPSAKIKELRVALGSITSLERYNGQLAVENMRVESKAFIEDTAKAIFEGVQFWIISIHDALGCDLENVDKVRELLMKNLTEGTGFPPLLKEEMLEIKPPDIAPKSAVDIEEVSAQFRGYQEALESRQKAVSGVEQPQVAEQKKQA